MGCLAFSHVVHCFISTILVLTRVDYVVTEQAGYLLGLISAPPSSHGYASPLIAKHLKGAYSQLPHCEFLFNAPPPPGLVNRFNVHLKAGAPSSHK